MPTRASRKTSTKPKELSDQALVMIAARFRALGEPMRLRLLNTLMAGERTVGQLVEAMSTSQANVSKHLAILREAGLVAVRKEGTTTFCFIADPIVNQLCEMMCRNLMEELQSKANAFD
jgi:DNA-binding transcriptional ArsR family regulator